MRQIRMQWTLLLGFLLVGEVCYGLTSLKHSCQIQIEVTPHQGVKKIVRFQSGLKSKAQCQALAQIHQKHFDDKFMRTKKVSYSWIRKKKTIPTRF